MRSSWLASRSEILAEHNEFIPRSATSNLPSTRKPKIQQTYSKRASKLPIQPTIPIQGHLSIDIPSLDSLPPEDHACHDSITKKRLISALDSNRVQRTASQPSASSAELSSIYTTPRDALKPQSQMLQTLNSKKRSISDFFRPIPHSSRSSSPTRRHNLSSPIPSSPQTIPSSPPSLHSADEAEDFLSHKKRGVKMNRKENIPLKGNGSDLRKKKDESDKKIIEANEEVRRNNA